MSRRANCALVHLERWPPGTAPSGAAVFVHNERVIQADPTALWDVLVEAESWPLWYPNARNVKVAGDRAELGPAALFSWQTFQVDVRSEVADFAPPRHLGWLWSAPGLYGYHGWRLDPHPRGTRVLTEETQRGPRATRLAVPLTAAVFLAHSVWLHRLASRVASA